ncbi:hypothetical protein CEXT_801981 [Caerostris extrusa]|uniref:Uncharacterized protein n=1 Tax=Caerostris extrusa TaxID=172846 RepID=A0AAV4Y6P5_CAEEX|nr:hypothetical protein CEXT_801981 [Caerostris extrusa]
MGKSVGAKSLSVQCQWRPTFPETGPLLHRMLFQPPTGRMECNHLAKRFLFHPSTPSLHKCISFSCHGNETLRINFSSEVRGGEKVHLIRRGIFSMPIFGFGGFLLTG